MPDLPQQLTSFIGREVELAELRRLLRERRLVTLTGAGGSGKTRLALATAATITRDFPDGTFLVELASLATPELVGEAVTRSLGIEPAPDQPSIEALTDFLRNCTALLVLDNCEHLLDECGRLASTLLASCADLRMLATSREPLGVAGECLFGVPLLSLPNPDETPDPERLLHFEAVQLFMDRAHLASRNFALTEKTALAVAQICIRLDGMPLAIELAAASLRTLPISQLATRLDQRFRLLTLSIRTALSRHQTLGALLDWSYALLDSRQRAVFQRLAIFPGDWNVGAAEPICAEESGDDSVGDAPQAHNAQAPAGVITHEEVLPTLMQLADKSLVQLEQSTGRYRMLETIHLYALGKLQESGEEETTARRHFDYYRNFVAHATAHLGGPDQNEWFLRLEREQINFRAALGWSIAKEYTEGAALLALALWKFWVARGYHREARRWLEQILALDTGSPKSGLPASLRAPLLSTLSVIAHTMNEFQEASRYHNEALRIWREQEDSSGIASALLDLGWQHFQSMNLEGACDYAQQSLVMARQIGDPAAVGAALSLLGRAAVEIRPLSEVVPILEECLSTWRSLGLLPEMATTLCNLARVEQRLGNLEHAGQLTLEALRLHTTLGNYNAMIEPLVLMVYFEFDAGQPSHKPGSLPYPPLGYLTSGKLPHGSTNAARLLGVMRAWEEKVVGRHTVQWDTLVTPLCDKLSEEMGAANFAREFETGRAITIEEIPQFAEVIVGPPTALYAEQTNRLGRSTGSVGSNAASAPIGAASATGLTQREVEVLKLVAEGLTNAQTAARLSVTPRTINMHLTSIYSKVGVTSRAGAVRFAFEHGLL